MFPDVFCVQFVHIDSSHNACYIGRRVWSLLPVWLFDIICLLVLGSPGSWRVGLLEVRPQVSFVGREIWGIFGWVLRCFPIKFSIDIGHLVCV